MSETERWREPIAALPSQDSIDAKANEGWRPVAIEWERGARAVSEDADKRPIPYGLRISSDCRHLEVDPTEKDVMRRIMAMIAADFPLSKIAAELNDHGFQTRAGSRWTQVQLFKLLPRIVEFAPEVLNEREWSESKKRLLSAVG